MNLNERYQAIPEQYKEEIGYTLGSIEECIMYKDTILKHFPDFEEGEFFIYDAYEDEVESVIKTEDELKWTKPEKDNLAPEMKALIVDLYELFLEEGREPFPPFKGAK